MSFSCCRNRLECVGCAECLFPDDDDLYTEEEEEEDEEDEEDEEY